LVSFTGWTGQSLNIQVTNNTIGAVNASLIAPDGSTLVSQASSDSSFNLTSPPLPSLGTYAVVVHPTSPTSGSITIGVGGHKGIRAPGVIVDPSNPTSQGLVGLYLMDERSGTSSTNVVNGQAAVFSGTTLPTWNSADPSISFPGGAYLTSYLSASSDSSFDQLTPGAITIVAKIYVPLVSANMGIVEKLDNNGGLSIGFSSSWLLTASVCVSGRKIIFQNGNGAIVPGRWIQVAFVSDWNANVRQVYLDGVAQSNPFGGAVNGISTTSAPM